MDSFLQLVWLFLLIESRSQKRGIFTRTTFDFRRMLDFCRQEAEAGRPVDVIACWDTKRFSRADSHETGWFLWELRKTGVRWMLTEADVLTDSPS